MRNTDNFLRRQLSTFQLGPATTKIVYDGVVLCAHTYLDLIYVAFLDALIFMEL